MITDNMSAELFASDISSLAGRPLAARMRPTSVEHVVGQDHLLAEGKPLRELINQKQPHSMIFWGPPGTGKTTLAQIVAKQTDSAFVALSAVLAGVKDIRAIMAAAQLRQKNENRSTVLFVDEVHRFNKSQQDAFLPFVEDGTITFIGATTENPSFELNNALLSRARVYVLKALETKAITRVIHRALSDKEIGLGSLELKMTDHQIELVANAADGDARRALTFLELVSDLAGDQDISNELIDEVVSGGHRRFDKGGEAFYDQISALHKSVRGSDPDAALYWLCRMLDGGCDAIYLARRIVRMASEDIGNADPRALDLALKAWDVQERLGSPEGELALAQAVLYLAVAAKSNATYLAYKRAMQFVRQDGSRDVPLHLRNAPTKLMKSLDYGSDYRYAHDEPDAFAAGENYFPEGVAPNPGFYEPVERGLESKMKAKLTNLRNKNREALS